MKTKYFLIIGMFVLLISGVFAFNFLINKQSKTLPLYQYKEGHKKLIGFTDQQTHISYFFNSEGGVYYVDSEGKIATYQGPIPEGYNKEYFRERGILN